MTEINEKQNKFHWLYVAGFCIILALPILNLPPYFFPPDWGKTIIFRIITTILLLFFFGQIFYGKINIDIKKIKNNKIIWSLCALLSVFFIATIFSVDQYFSLWGSPYRGGGFITYGFYFILAILSFIILKSSDWKKAWITSISAGFFVCIIALIQYYGLLNNIFISEASRPSSTVGNPIFLGIYLLLLFFPTLSFAIKEKSKYIKIFYTFSLFIFLYTILITGSRAAYLGILVGIIYFLLIYPQKIKAVKISLIIFLFITISLVAYANISPKIPAFIQGNRVTNNIINRLSISQAFGDERYKAWQTVIKEIQDKPVFGWGPENLAVGFDKNYNPNITPSPWWDKAHNIFLDIGAQAGILGIIAYLCLYIILFWQLQKSKNKIEYENKIIINGLQATLIGYLVANFFSFDSFPTYLLFFFIIGYTLYLTYKEESKKFPNHNLVIKKIILGGLLILSTFFLWQYNFLPFLINAEINSAKNLVEQRKCDIAFAVLDKILEKHSFADSYLRMMYVDDLKTCAGYYPENNLSYANKGIILLKEAVKIQPLYTRYWIHLGSFTVVLAEYEENQLQKTTLLDEASQYFDKANTLSPMHAETIVERSKIYQVAKDYNSMLSEAEKCIKVNPNLKDCFWIKAIAEIYLKNINAADIDIRKSREKGLYINIPKYLNDLAVAYLETKNYQRLAEIYQKLIIENPDNYKYYSALAATYAEIGEYQKAKEMALEFFKLVPSAKEEVNTFLKSLPI